MKSTIFLTRQPVLILLQNIYFLIQISKRWELEILYMISTEISGHFLTISINAW